MDERLTIFLMVARIGQATKAARLLNMSPSTVSQQIAALEREVGARLFDRTGRGMHLTASGQILFRGAQEMDSLWRETVRATRIEADASAHLRIAASHTVTELYLPRPLGRFRAQWPETQIHLTMTNSTSVVDRVSRGDADLGLIEGAPVQAHTHIVPLWRDTLGLIVSRLHSYGSRSIVTIPELTTQDWILREPGSGTRRVFEEALLRVGVSLTQFNILMELSSLRAIIAMVANNVGVSVVSSAIVESPEVMSPFVKVVAIQDLPLDRTIHAVMSRHPSRSSINLLDHLQQDVVIRRQRGPDKPEK